MRIKKWMGFGVLLLLACWLVGCQAQNQTQTQDENQEALPITANFFAMDTLFQLMAGGDQALVQQVFGQAQKEVKRIEALTGRYVEAKAGNLAFINQMAGIEPVVVEGELWDLLKLSWEWTEKTQGAFSLALGPLSDLWKNQQKIPPTAAEVAAALPLCNSRDVVFNEAEKSVYLAKKGMSLDLGGIAKGYAMDRIGALFLEANLTSAFIDGGGSILVLGNNLQNEPWRIGLAHPRIPGELGTVVQVTDGAIISSGDYQRYFEYEGKRYHHILDAKTGYPAQGTIATTVIAKNATLGDVLSTAAFVMGPEKAQALVVYCQGLAITNQKGTVKILGAFGEYQIAPWAEYFTVAE